MAKRSESRLLYYLAAAVLAACVIVGIAISILGDGGRSGAGKLKDGVIATGTEASGDAEHVRWSNTLVSVAEIGVASSRNAKTKAYSPDEELFLKDTIASFRSTLAEHENRRTSFLWEQKRGDGYTNTIGIKAPSIDEIGEISSEMAAQLAHAPIRLTGELRTELQKQYDAFTNFTRGNKVLYVTRIEGVSTAKILEGYVDDISSIKPAASGEITVEGRWSERPFEINNVPENHRYSHILLRLPPQPSTDAH